MEKKEPTVYEELEAIRLSPEYADGMGKTEFSDLLTTDINSYNNIKNAKQGKNFWARIALWYMKHDKGLKLLFKFRKERKQT